MVPMNVYIWLVLALFAMMAWVAPSLTLGNEGNMSMLFFWSIIVAYIFNIYSNLLLFYLWFSCSIVLIFSSVLLSFFLMWSVHPSLIFGVASSIAMLFLVLLHWNHLRSAARLMMLTWVCLGPMLFYLTTSESVRRLYQPSWGAQYNSFNYAIAFLLTYFTPGLYVLFREVGISRTIGQGSKE